MTSGSSAAAIMVPESPLSPEDSTTVTPASTAASLALARSWPEVLVGSDELPKDSEITSACTVAAALSIPASTCDSIRTGVSTCDRSTTDAPGASPLITNEHPGGTSENGSAPEYWYTTVPCAAIEDTSP